MSKRTCETTEESLLYRQPMQVREVLVKRGGIFNFDTLYEYPICPRCDTPFEHDYQAYCSYCGQKLKWTYYSKAKARYANDVNNAISQKKNT